MCGVAGIVDLAKAGRIKPDYMESMASLLRHRGPDEKGIFISNDCNLALLNQRLSIIDLKSGTQPIFNENRSVCVILNGEIYNYKDIKDELIKKGHIFRTNSDTETIVHLYEERGAEFPEYLDGMFAIMLWDFNKEKGYLVRDRLGKKPLYYYKDPRWLIIASELTSILKSGIKDLDFEVDRDSLSQFFTFGMTVGGNSIIKNIKKVPAAGTAVFDYRSGELRVYKYWQVPALKEGRSYSFENVVDSFTELFEEAVKKRFVADVKVGAFLSGGIDSTAVVATARHLGYDIDTYTIGFAEDRFDESGYARKLSGILGIKNKSITLDKEISKDDVVDVMSRFDEPFYDHSGVPTYFLSKMVSSDLKVVLSGDGGDENLMGYNHYDDYYYYPRVVTRGLPEGLISILNRAKLAHWDKLFAHRFSRVTPYYFERLSKSGINRRQADIKPILDKYINRDFYDCMSKIDLNLYLVDDILVKVDRMSMQNSLEVRCPLLDYKLVEYLSGIPSNIKKFGQFNKKAILKEYLKKLLYKTPEALDIINRKKHGFRFPIGKYMSGLENDIRGWMGERRFIEYFCFDKEVLSDMCDDFFNNGNKKGGKSLWHLVCLYLWWHKFKGVLS